MYLVADDPKTWTGDEIRELRLRLRMTQASLADALGYEYARTISDLEHERRYPSGAVRVLLDLMDEFDGLPSRQRES